MTKNEMIYYHQRRITTKGRKLLKDGIKMSTENTANRCQITSRTHKTPARHRAGDKKTQLRELLCLFCSVEVLTGGARFHNPSICTQQKILFHSQLLTLALKVLWSALFFCQRWYFTASCFTFTFTPESGAHRAQQVEAKSHARGSPWHFPSYFSELTF